MLYHVWFLILLWIFSAVHVIIESAGLRLQYSQYTLASQREKEFVKEYNQ